MLLLLSSDHFALPLLEICIGSWMLRDWLAGLLQLSSYFALSRSQSFGCFACRWLYSCLACRWLCSSACCWLCSSWFFSSFLPFSTLGATLRAHRRFDVLHAVLVPVLLYFVLLATGSLALVLCWIFTTCSLAVALSLILSRDTLWYSPAPPTPLLSIAPVLIVGSR